MRPRPVPFYDPRVRLGVPRSAHLRPVPGGSGSDSGQKGRGLETGPRYQTGLSDLEGLAGTGLQEINDAGSRWSMPVVATLIVRF